MVYTRVMPENAAPAPADSAVDHTVAAMLQALQRSGHLGGVLAEMTSQEREIVEAADARHSARQRAAGRKGW